MSDNNGYTYVLGEILDVSQIGGKGASLARMIAAGFPVPAGFSVTGYAYRKFLSDSGNVAKISCLLEGLDTSDFNSVEDRAASIQNLILNAPVPVEIESQILAHYQDLMARPLPDESGMRLVSVRSSATAEDLQGASFAGQHDTFLNVFGDEEVLRSVKKCWASLWNPQAILYRIHQGFDHMDVSMPVVVQEMVPATSSGVMFTVNPVTGDDSEIVINSTWGLGEAVVSGVVTPDHIVVSKETLEVKALEIAPKETMVTNDSNGRGTAWIDVSPELVYVPSVSSDQLKQLARIGKALEQHYGAPQDIEWCFKEDTLSLLQSRPITTL